MSEPTVLPEIVLVEPKVFKDERGWFYESYSARTLASLGIDNVFVQDNHSFSVNKGSSEGFTISDRRSPRPSWSAAPPGAFWTWSWTFVTVPRTTPGGSRWY